jgi:hypothetical protein
MWDKIINALRKLQLITFAILLGAGMVVTALASWIIASIAYLPWPETAAEGRVNALAVGLWIVLGLIGVIVVTLAFGKIEKISLSNGVLSGEVEFDNDQDDEQKSEPEAPKE